MILWKNPRMKVFGKNHRIKVFKEPKNRSFWKSPEKKFRGNPKKKFWIKPWSKSFMSNLKINVLGQPFKVKNLGQTQKQKLWTNSKKGF